MKQRQIRRTYLAIVQGIAPEQGTIDAPIGRAADSTIERQVDFANGESAVTHYERLAVRNDHSLLEIHLETGRTHQIRYIWDTSDTRSLRIICIVRYMIILNVSPFILTS